MTSRLSGLREHRDSLAQQLALAEDGLRREYGEALVALYHGLFAYAADNALASGETMRGDVEHLHLDVALVHRSHDGDLPPVAVVVRDERTGQQIDFKNSPSAALLVAVVTAYRADPST